MIRLVSWIVASLLVAAAIAWLVALPGTVTVEFGGYRMQPRLGSAAFVLLAVMAVGVVVWTVVSRILNAPRAVARRARHRRHQQGVEALSDGFIALQAGDPTKARLLAREASLRLPDNAAARLLEARADLALGDMPSAREHYRALISNSRTAVAALHGLYDQARQQGRREAAITFANKAVSLAPGTAWASAAVFDDLAQKGAWAEALAMVGAEPTATREDKALKRRRQAVIETARARLAEAGEPLAALDYALTALKLLPDFVPAALIAARIHSNRGEARKAMSLLRRVYRATGHPDIATLYAAATPGVSAVERLKRVRDLIDVPPETRSAALVLARAAVDAFDWPLARQVLAPHAASEPSQAVCLMMAEIEEGQNGDQGKAREWLARAVRAPRDPVWTADGVTSDEWEPVSPITGKLDAFEWKVPVSTASRPPPVPPPAPASPPAPAQPLLPGA